jgi:hypothetical protein
MSADVAPLGRPRAGTGSPAERLRGRRPVSGVSTRDIAVDAVVERTAGALA